MIIIKDIRLESHCEHHMVPILGKAHLAYIPNNRVVGISKLARVVDVYGKRLQTQETMTAQIAESIDRVLQPKGVAVVVDALLWLVGDTDQVERRGLANQSPVTAAGADGVSEAGLEQGEGALGVRTV